MKAIFVTLAILLGFGVQSPAIAQAEMEQLYVEALSRRIDLLLSSEYKYIELNDITSNVKDEMATQSIYKFLPYTELAKISLRQKKALRVYRMTHKEISLDTVDVNFSQLMVTAKRTIYWSRGLKFKKIYSVLDCGGTEGYIPDFRFVKDAETHTWRLVKTETSTDK